MLGSLEGLPAVALNLAARSLTVGHSKRLMMDRFCFSSFRIMAITWMAFKEVPPTSKKLTFSPIPGRPRTFLHIFSDDGFQPAGWLCFRHAVKTLCLEPEFVDRLCNPADVVQFFPNPLQVLRSGSHAKSKRRWKRWLLHIGRCRLVVRLSSLFVRIVLEHSPGIPRERATTHLPYFDTDRRGC